MSDGSTITITAKNIKSSCSSLSAYNGKFVITSSATPSLLAKWPGAISVATSDIDGGNQSDHSATGTDNPSNITSGFNLTITRSDIFGGKDSVECGGNCYIADSYLHGQHSYGGAHIQGFLSSGGSHMVLKHNSIACDPPTAPQAGGGCTADVALFGDFAQVRDVVVDNNQFIAGMLSTYCVYAGYQPGKNYPVSSGVIVQNNVFGRGTNGKCGEAGPVTSYSSNSGNTWTGNVWQGSGGVPGSTVAP